MQRACASCHGVDGSLSLDGGIPRLAGLDRAYLDKQIHDLKTRQGEVAPRRPNPRAGSGDSLTEAEVDAVTGWLSVQPWPSQSGKDDDSRGGRLFGQGDAARGVPACGTCHGAQALGDVRTGAPRLAGQQGPYLRSQLLRFRSGARANSATMQQIARQLDDDAIEALVDYLQAAP